MLRTFQLKVFWWLLAFTFLLFLQYYYYSLFRHRPWWSTEHCHHADGQQRHVLTNERECRGQQNMCWWEDRGRCMWCKYYLCTCNWNWLYLKTSSKILYNPVFIVFLQRDYGGPLVCQEHERKVIIGVSIQRTKCASSQPALFVNVAFYSEWIYKVFKLYPTLERNWWFGLQ